MYCIRPLVWMKKHKPMKNLEQYWQNGTQFLGSKYAILGGAMSWVSENNLVAAISNAGGFGILATGAMPKEMIMAEIDLIRQKTSHAFGVNIVTMRPDIDDIIAICIDKNISHVALAGGLPTAASIQKLKEGGIKVICFAPSAIVAKRLIKQGADALVIEGSEAGGHVGPVSTMVLMQEILPHIRDVPVFVAGGIGSGESMAIALKMGASGVQIGTLLACTAESIAHENFKNMFIKANSRDAVTTVQIDPEFPVIPVRALKNKGTEAFLIFQQKTIKSYKKQEISKNEAILAIEHFWAGALKRAVIDGDVENGSVMAGQSVGLIKNVLPVAEVINTLVEEADKNLKE